MQWIFDQAAMQQLLHEIVQCRHSHVAQKVDSVDTPELGVAESAAKQADPADVAPSTIKATV